ncbi:MAG: alkaline phosphatase family protein [Candidatus Helarchaeota archaeon]
MTRAERVILIVLDDVRADQFFDLIEKNELPNIKKYFYDGIQSNMTSIFPAITIPARLTLLTGTYPDHYAIPGMHCYEREKNKIHNFASLHQWDIPKILGGDAKTIYEQVDGNTADIFSLLFRGADYYFPTKFQTIKLYFWHFYLMKTDVMRVNEFTIIKILKLFEKPRKYFENSDPPRFISAWIFSSDSMLHDYGYDSPQYLNNLKDIDKWFGVLIEGNTKYKGLKKMGYFDDTTFIIASDHGNYKAKKHIYLEDFFTKHKLIPLKFNKKVGNFDCAMGSVGQFYFLGKDKFSRPTIEEMTNYGPSKINLFDVLLKIEGMKLLYYRDDNNTNEKGKINVLYKENDRIFEAIIEYKGDKTKIEFQDKDFYGYSNDNLAAKLIDNKYHTIDEWLAYTHHLNFPIIVDQITRLFKNKNSCDILCSTIGETIFNYEHGKTQNEHIYGHDICTYQGMTTPLLISGSNIPNKKLEFSKSSDIVPTIVKLLNGDLASSVIGKSLL